MVLISHLMQQLSFGTVQLHLVDRRGRPIANHMVWLGETNSTKEIRPFGDLWFLPSDITPLKGKTDRSGNIQIKGVPQGISYTVITKFGPRFDPILKGASLSRERPLDVMRFEGAVFAGDRRTITIAFKDQIVGTVRKWPSGKPMPGIFVELNDTGFGHMGGYPGTVLDVTQTDSKGRYVFRNLPNCTFSIAINPANVMLVVEAKTQGNGWERIGSTNDNGTYYGGSRLITCSGPTTICDFRIVRRSQAKSN